jgi:hypothetical protein
VQPGVADRRQDDLHLSLFSDDVASPVNLCPGHVEMVGAIRRFEKQNRLRRSRSSIFIYFSEARGFGGDSAPPSNS